MNPMHQTDDQRARVCIAKAAGVAGAVENALRLMEALRRRWQLCLGCH